jgi:hypothetical protein
MPDVADDPDLAHLFELLRMLPGPRENLRFWEEVAGWTHPRRLGALRVREAERHLEDGPGADAHPRRTPRPLTALLLRRRQPWAVEDPQHRHR